MATADKLSYLNTTKGKIKDSINITGANITNETTFRNYAVLLKDKLAELLKDPSPIWDNFPKTTATGTTIQVNTYNSLFEYELQGNTEQDGTPTPTTPIPIDVVSGLQEVEIVGKNLFDISKIVKGRLDNGVLGYESNTTNLTLNDDSFSFTTNANYRGVTSDYIVITSGNYALSSNVLNSNYSIKIACYDSSKVWLQDASFTGLGSETTRKFTISNGVKYIRIYFSISSAGSITIGFPQLEKSSTATTYEPYIGNTYPLYLGVENLFEPVMPSRTFNGLNITKNEDGSYTINGTASANTTLRLDQPTQGFGNPKYYDGTYTLSIKTDGSTLLNVIIMNFDTYNYLMNTNGTQTKNITSGSTGSFIYLNIPSGTTINNQTYYIQLEKGNQATSYSPYFTPIELCKIGTYQDYIYKDNGSWYLHKEIGKVVLNGSEDWRATSQTNIGTYRNRILFADYTNNNYKGVSSNSEVGLLLSDKYIAEISNSAGTYGGHQGMSLSTGGDFYIYDNTYNTNDASLFKTWLSTHNTIVYYVLANPTTEEITNSELVSQLNSIELVDGENNITITGDLAAIMNLTVLERE